MNHKSLSTVMIPVALLVALTFALSGCGNGNHNLALTQGNWSMSMSAPVQGAAPFYLGGNLTENGTNVSATMYVINSCINPSQQQSFSGTMNHNNVTLTSVADPAGEVITLVLSGTGSSLSGSYSITGGVCANGDHGTVNANSVPSISGTWSGPLNDSNDPNATLSIALTQASTASADGTFALSGTLTYTNSLCEATGTITNGSFAGPFVIAFNATTSSGDTVNYSGGMLDSTTNPHQISTGTYSVSGSSSCNNDTSVPVFTKQ